MKILLELEKRPEARCPSLPCVSVSSRPRSLWFMSSSLLSSLLLASHAHYSSLPLLWIFWVLLGFFSGVHLFTGCAASSFFRAAYLCLVTSCLLFAFRDYSRLPRIDSRHETEGDIISRSCLLRLPVWVFAPTNVRTHMRS